VVFPAPKVTDMSAAPYFSCPRRDGVFHCVIERNWKKYGRTSLFLLKSGHDFALYPITLYRMFREDNQQFVIAADGFINAVPELAEAKDWHGMRRFRLRFLWRVNCEALRIAAGQNLKRLLKKRGWGRHPFPVEALCTFFLEYGSFFLSIASDYLMLIKLCKTTLLMSLGRSFFNRLPHYLAKHLLIQKDGIQFPNNQKNTVLE
jgi:hypothetical protein